MTRARPNPIAALRTVGRRIASGPDYTRKLGVADGAPVANGASSAATDDLERRRDELAGQVAELQWDLGGLVYEMAIRDHIQLDVLVRRAALLQDADAELGEVERILRMERTGTTGSCGSCGALHSRGAVYCWQCGQPLLRHVPSAAIARS